MIQTLWLLAAAPAALAWPALRQAIESRMSLHMLLELPLLFAAGWAAHSLVRRRATLHRGLRSGEWLDWRGWSGAVYASLVAAAWMLPSALDAALMSRAVELAKLASCWLAGFWLAASWRRMDDEVALFCVGNIAWMAATAGMLYQQLPQTLCVNYLRDDQGEAGVGLVLLALALGAVAIRRAIRAGR